MRTTQIFNDEDQFSIIANYKMISFGNITVENFSFLKPRRQNVSKILKNDTLLTTETKYLNKPRMTEQNVLYTYPKYKAHPFSF